MRFPEKNDDETIINVIKYIAKSYPRERILKEPFLIFHDTGKITIKPTRIIKEDLTLNCVIQHPDIILLDKKQNLAAIVEIDGSIHTTRPGRKQTNRRNNTYFLFQVPFFILKDDEHLEGLDDFVKQLEK